MKVLNPFQQEEWIEAYRVKPGDTLESIATELKLSLDELGDFNALRIDYDAQSGDTLASVARRFKTTPKMLTEWNDLPDQYTPFPGQRLKVGWEPMTVGDYIYYPIYTMITRSIENEIQQANGTEQGETRYLNENTKYDTYTVQSGDTLQSIAKRKNVNAEDITDLNGLSLSDKLLPGEILYIPKPNARPTATRQRQLSPGELEVYAGKVVRDTALLKSKNGALLKRVKKGETLPIVGQSQGGYTVLLEQRGFGWMDKATIELGDLVGITKVISPSSTSSYASSSGHTLLKHAYTYLGVPYKMGGNTYDEIDCSGFVKNVFVAIGIWSPGAPRTARTQISIGQPVEARDLRPGDRVYFDNARLGFGVVDHTGIYIGGGQMVHASPPCVRISALFSGYYWRIYAGARR